MTFVTVLTEKDKAFIKESHAKNIPQKNIAKEINVCQATVSRIINGKDLPKKKPIIIFQLPTPDPNIKCSNCKHMMLKRDTYYCTMQKSPNIAKTRKIKFKIVLPENPSCILFKPKRTQP